MATFREDIQWGRSPIVKRPSVEYMPTTFEHRAPVPVIDTKIAEEGRKAQEFLSQPWYKQLFTKRVAREIPKATFDVAVETPIKFGVSALETPKTLLTGRASQREYSIPFTGTRFKSYQSEAETRARDIVDDKKPLYTAVAPFIEVPLAGMEVGGYAKGASIALEQMIAGKTQREVMPMLSAITRTAEKPPKKPAQLTQIEKEREVASALKDATDTPEKVSIIDYFRTPKNVLKKIGLGKQAEKLDNAYTNYKLQVKDEIDKIGKWAEKVPSKESAKNIFRYLDGQNVKLTKQEQAVAKEIRQYLSDWAKKLGLPKDKQISNYITHIFERDFIKKDFDQELAKIIADKPAGSVYDPFLQKRLGKKGYVEDVWRALNAYVKRATRKYNLDPALKDLKEASKTHPLENVTYIKKLTHGINMRPTDVDTLMDNFIKQTPVGYKLGQRPVNVLTQAIRKTIYRGALGGNVGSAVKNLSQSVNTYAELGEKYTIKGFADLLRKGTKELYDTGVLDDSFIEDQSLPVFKGLLKKIDDWLYYFFETAEKINRGAAYYGAKAKALKMGMDEAEAIDYARNVVAKTQFKFGGVHTPAILQSDIAKTLGQFQSFSLKQAEFLGGKIKDKDILGLTRFIGATIAMYGTIGKALGWKLEDMLVPSFRFSSPATSIIGSAKDYATAQDEQERAAAKRNLLKTGRLLVPAGVQIGKTVEGLGAMSRGYTETPSGRVKYPISDKIGNWLRAGLFGQYSFPEAREYFDNNRKPLGEVSSEVMRRLPREDQRGFYDMEMKQRELNRLQNDVLYDMSGVTPEMEDFIDKVLTKASRSPKFQQLSAYERAEEMKKTIQKIKNLYKKRAGEENFPKFQEELINYLQNK